jgi:hypothetical protein
MSSADVINLSLTAFMASSRMTRSYSPVPISLSDSARASLAHLMSSGLGSPKTKWPIPMECISMPSFPQATCSP